MSKKTGLPPLYGGMVPPQSLEINHRTLSFPHSMVEWYLLRVLLEINQIPRIQQLA